jgi:hypothetical protein
MEILCDISHIKDLPTLKEYAQARGMKTTYGSTIASITDNFIADFFSDKIVSWFNSKQFEEFSKEADKLMRAQTPNLRGYIKRVAKLRVILSQTLGKNNKLYKWHVENAGPTKEEYSAANNKMKENREVRLSNVTKVTLNQVQDMMNHFLSSNDLLDKVLAIQLASGARTIEALKVSHFEKVSYFRDGMDSGHMIRVIGLAKSKSKYKDELIRPLLFINTKDFLTLVKRVREGLEKQYQLSSLSDTQINDMFSNQLIKRVRRLKIKGIKSAHDMRKLYAAATHEDDDVDSTKHVKDVLGQKSYDSAMSYVNIKVTRT